MLRDDLRSFRGFTNSREAAGYTVYCGATTSHGRNRGEAGTTASTGLEIASLCSFRDWQRHLEKLNASRVFGNKLGNR